MSKSGEPLYVPLSNLVRHPDKNKSPEAHEKMLEINKAYEVHVEHSKLHTCMYEY